MGIATAALLYLALGAIVWTLFSRARPGSGVDAFVAGFDRLFAVRWVRGVPLPSFLRSVMVSCASLLVLAALWLLGKDDVARLVRFGRLDALWNGQTRWLLLVYGGATVVTNWLPDYVSLVQSRWMIDRIARQRGPLGWIVWLVADAALTLCVAFGAIYLGMKISLPFFHDVARVELGCLTASTFTLGHAWEIFVSGLAFRSPPATINYDAAGIYVYSTFLTSVWLWLHLFASFAAKIAAVAFPRSRRAATHGFLAWSAVIVFSVVFWSTRFLSPPKADVRLVHGADDAAIAAEWRAQLEASDLRVTEDGEAVLVVVVEPLRDSSAGAALEAEVACGARGRRSVRSFRRDAPVRSVVDWARHATSMLSPAELRECRLRDGLPPPPRCGPPAPFTESSD